jgi:hypothetical protein
MGLLELLVLNASHCKMLENVHLILDLWTHYVTNLLRESRQDQCASCLHPPHPQIILQWASVHCSCILNAFTILIILCAVWLCGRWVFVSQAALVCWEDQMYVHVHQSFADNSFFRIPSYVFNQPLSWLFNNSHHPSTHPFLYSSICSCTHELIGSFGLW